MRNLPCQIRNWMGNIVIRHSKNWNLGDGSVTALHTPSSLINSSQISVPVEFKKKMEILLQFLSFLYIFFKKSKIAQIYYYDPQSAGINLQSPQINSTPWTLTLGMTFLMNLFVRKNKKIRIDWTFFANSPK